MKKLTALFMSLMLICSLAACSTAPSNQGDSTSTPEPRASEQTSGTTGAPDTTPDESSTEPIDSSDNTISTAGKTLVVYYSASGNTESVASYIAAATGGDILELVPVNDYSSADLNYRDNDSRVVYEHEHPDAREIELVQNTVDNWNDYDTVFIGFPI